MSTQSLPASHSDAQGHEHHHPALQHHFAEMGQQFDTAKIGMWLFLATEILLFGGLFVGYGIMHMKHPEAFVSAHHHLDRVLGAVNTVVLLVSSWTMVMGVWAAKTNRQGLLKLMLAVTILLALVFLGVKYFEYGHKIHEGLLPGKFYSYKGPSVPGEFVFFSFYFMMTGLHGLHIVGGVAALTWVLIRAIKGHFGPEYYTPVDLAGLYWHLVDLIWIYLFPLMYLIS